MKQNCLDQRIILHQALTYQLLLHFTFFLIQFRFSDVLFSSFSLDIPIYHSQPSGKQSRACERQRYLLAIHCVPQNYYYILCVLCPEKDYKALFPQSSALPSSHCISTVKYHSTQLSFLCPHLSTAKEMSQKPKDLYLYTFKVFQVK